MRVKLVPVAEVKCNFCLQWIQVPQNTISSLFICLPCLHRFAKGTLTLDSSGHSHILHLSPFPTPNQPLSQLSQLPQLPQLKQQQQNMCNFTTSRIQPISLQIPQKFKELVKSGVSTKPNQNDEDLRNNFNLPDMLKAQQQLETFKNRSQIIQKVPSESQTQDSSQRNSFLNGFYSTVKKETKKKDYQFFFRSTEIDNYKEHSTHEAVDRLFGTEIDCNYSQNQLFLELRRNKRLAIKSHRSNPPFQSSQNIQKLREQTLKHKVDSYLQTRYQSTSLHRILAMNVRQAYQQTSIQGKNVELVSFNVNSIDLSCYLSLLETETVGTLKLINMGLQNEHLSTLIEWMGGKKIERLVLTCNRLTDQCIQLFLNRALPNLKELYLGRNRINKFKMREQILELRGKFIIYL